MEELTVRMASKTKGGLPGAQLGGRSYVRRCESVPIWDCIRVVVLVHVVLGRVVGLDDRICDVVLCRLAWGLRMKL